MILVYGTQTQLAPRAAHTTAFSDRVNLDGKLEIVYHIRLSKQHCCCFVVQEKRDNQTDINSIRTDLLKLELILYD